MKEQWNPDDLAALLEARDPLRPVAGAAPSDALATRWQALAAAAAALSGALADIFERRTLLLSALAPQEQEEGP